MPTDAEIEADLVRIRKRLLEYYTSSEADVWLHSEQPLLVVLGDKRTAFQLIEDGETATVDRLLSQIDDGVYI